MASERPILTDAHGPLFRAPERPRGLLGAAPLWYPKATVQSWGVDGGSILGGYGRRVTLHTTETTVFPGYDEGTKAPHNTVAVVSGRAAWRQHVPYDRASRALRNPAGGVQTNRTGTIQVEIVWYSGKIRDLPAVLFDALAEWADWLQANQGVPKECHVRFTATAASTQVARISAAAWNGLVGYHGHEHVPENDHYDPSVIDITRILRADPPKEWWTVGIPKDELVKIRGAGEEALAGDKGQQAIRQALAAEADAILKVIGTNQAFVRQDDTPQVYLMLSGQLLHIPSADALVAIGGSGAFGKVLVYPEDAPVWRLPISGQQPGEQPTPAVLTLAEQLEEAHGNQTS